jgi:hypothetical protein
MQKTKGFVSALMLVVSLACRLRLDAHDQVSG